MWKKTEQMLWISKIDKIAILILFMYVVWIKKQEKKIFLVRWHVVVVFVVIIISLEIWFCWCGCTSHYLQQTYLHHDTIFKRVKKATIVLRWFNRCFITVSLERITTAIHIRNKTTKMEHNTKNTRRFPTMITQTTV